MCIRDSLDVMHFIFSNLIPVTIGNIIGGGMTVSYTHLQILCANGRINGAFKIGEIWAIPYDAKKTKDKRTKKDKSPR